MGELREKSSARGEARANYHKLVVLKKIYRLLCLSSGLINDFSFALQISANTLLLIETHAE